MPEVTPSTDEFGFNLEVRAKVVALLFIDPYSLGDCLKTMRPEFFDNPIDQRIAGIMLKYLAEYGQPITVDILDGEFQKLLREPRVPAEEYSRRYTHILDQVSEEGLAYAKDQARDWLIYQAYKATIIASVDAVKAKDFDKIDQLYAKAQEIRFGSIGESGLEVVNLADVEDRDPEWFWQDHFLKNELNIIAGIQGTGKSYFTHWLAACVTTGRQFPGTFWPTPKGRVVFLCYEDPPYRVKRRINACGGDASFVSIVRGTKRGELFSLQTDLPRLRAELKKLPDTVLLIIDHVVSFFGLGKADTNKGSDVRAVLLPLCKLAEEFHVTLLGVMHLNKSGDMSPIHRLSGASAFGEVARTVWLIERDKADKNRRYFSPLKLNDGQEPPAMTWSIGPDGAVGFSEGQTPPPIEEQLSPHPKPKSKKQQAKEFLLQTLQNGPMLAEEVDGLAENEGINHWTLESAKKEMGVVSTRRTDGEGSWQEGKWEWSLPPELTSKAS
jgi:hypothetical protein